jgi:uncharacterized protein YndB with AHSA1/START domain
VPEQHRIERTYPTTAGKVWDLWTTPEGIESWWAPDGFTVEVEKLELEPGGELVYTMTATAPEQVGFMRNAGLPLTATSRKRFTEVDRPQRLAYMSWSTSCPTRRPMSSSRCRARAREQGRAGDDDCRFDARPGLDGASSGGTRERTR